MPKFKDAPTTRVYLPSTYHEQNEDDRAWVEMRTKVYLGDTLAVTNIQDSLESNLASLTRLITAWNYTDEDGRPFPVTTENMQKLEKSDYEFLDRWIGENLQSHPEGLSAEEKKTSSATSIPVSTDEAPPSTPPTAT